MFASQAWLRRPPPAQPDRHVKLLRIRFAAEAQPFRDPLVVAAQLKVLAISTDGPQAASGAFDPELLDRGMRFRFTSELKRDEFKGRVQNYLSSTVTRRLTFSA